jgi:Trk K+ transport system NAD-binding subunit
VPVSGIEDVTSARELKPQEPSVAAVEVVVVGDDALGVEVCRRLAGAGRRIAAVWPVGARDLDEFIHLNVAPILADAGRAAAVLSLAGVRLAKTVVAVTRDDQLNLRIAIAARDLNPGVRVVLRQFNRWLGRKITHQLANSEAVSPETHSAATFAASCLNKTVFHAIEFPRYSEKLVTFCRAPADELSLGGQSVSEIESRRDWHVLGIGERRFPPKDAVVGATDVLTFACRLEAAPDVPPASQSDLAPLPKLSREEINVGRPYRRIRLDPILVGFALALFTIVLSAATFFQHELSVGFADALYLVISTATTTGSNELQLINHPLAAKFIAILLMVSGISMTAIILAYVTAAITRRSIEFSQGRHPMSGSGHVLVCGFGNVGSRVVSYLLHRGKRVAVIDRSPDVSLAEAARAQGAHIMTADAASEAALSMARVENAAAVLAVTDSDSANIEIGLTALAYVPAMPIILRIAEPELAGGLLRHFNVRASYSATSLAAPLVAGLALEHGSRGTIDIAGREFPLVQRAVRDERSGNEVVLATEDDLELVLRKG